MQDAVLLDLRKRLEYLERREIPVIGGGGAGAPNDAAYLTLALDAGLAADFSAGCDWDALA